MDDKTLRSLSGLLLVLWVAAGCSLAIPRDEGEGAPDAGATDLVEDADDPNAPVVDAGTFDAGTGENNGRCDGPPPHGADCIAES